MTSGLTACKPQETEVPFETVSKGDTTLVDRLGMAYGATLDRIDLLVATDLTETLQVPAALSTARPDLHLKEVSDIDYDKFMALIAYFGARMDPRSAITVEKIVQTGNVVNVTVSTFEPTYGDRNIIHPIHVVKIKRADLPVKGELVFNLLKDNGIILTRKHFVP